MGKTYNQFCPIANALDLVGERWALLVVRELKHGALRYTDLLERLGSCSTNILAQRLRDLEANGIVERRTIPPPTPATLYELTPAGESLGPVLRELALWGARTLGPPGPDVVLPPGWLERAVTVAAAPVAPPGRFAIASGEEHVVLRDGVVTTGEVDVEVTLAGPPPAVHGLLVEGSLDGLELTGSREAAGRLAASLAQSAAASRRSTSNASLTSASVVR